MSSDIVSCRPIGPILISSFWFWVGSPVSIGGFEEELTNMEMGCSKELPVALWNLDPMRNAYVKLLIGQIRQLPQFTDVKFSWRLHNHPIFRVSPSSLELCQKEHLR